MLVIQSTALEMCSLWAQEFRYDEGMTLCCLVVTYSVSKV